MATIHRMNAKGHRQNLRARTVPWHWLRHCCAPPTAMRLVSVAAEF
jgi:hypothetical protein